MGKVIRRGKEARDKAVEILINGGSIEEAANATGYGRDYVRQLGAANGIRFHKRKYNDEHIQQLCREGKTAKEIGQIIGAKSLDTVYKALRKANLKCAKTPKDVIETRICERCGDSFVCQANSDQRFCSQNCRGNQNKKYSEEEKKKYVESFLDPAFIYIGGYVDCDHKVTIGCVKCGAEFDRSMVTIRKHHRPTCPVCIENENRIKAEEKEQIKREKEEQAAQRKRDKEAEELLMTQLVQCEICGKIFATKRSKIFCCSPECSKKRANRLSSHRKDKRISKDKRVDYGITATALYRRDNGVCWICGGQCNLNDYIIREGTIICGDYYPSVDHIVPVCQGGADAWDNVRLAHRKCNSDRYRREMGKTSSPSIFYDNSPGRPRRGPQKNHISLDLGENGKEKAR